jgi:rod shape-determining protein MreD
MIRTSRRFELLFLTSLPALITLALALFFLTAKHINGLNHFMPALPLIPIFYWGMTHARDMPYWFVFALGLVMDSVMGLPLGLSSLLNVFFLMLLHAQRKYIHKEGFVIKWAYFALLLGVTTIASWVMLSLFASRAQPFSPAFIQWLLTLCCYPVLHQMFDNLSNYISSRRWRILHGRI